MLVSELVVDGKGLFHYMSEEGADFLALVDVPTVDLMFRSMYGCRVVSPSVRNIIGADGVVTEDSMRSIVKMLLLMYGKAWDTLYKMMIADIPTETYRMITTESITDNEASNHSSTTENTKTDIDRVTGYNSDDYVDDSMKEVQVDDVVTHEGTRSNERTVSKEVTGHRSSVVRELERISKFVQNTLIFEVVFRNTIEFVGMLIY